MEANLEELENIERDERVSDFEAESFNEDVGD
jgi:hypothetical protein